MSYPQGPPGSPGYPPAQQPTTQFTAPTQQFVKAEPAPAAPAGPGQLPMYLTVAVVVLGLAVYLSSFGPLFTSGADFFTPTLLDLGVVAAVAAGLTAGVSLLPKQKALPALVAVLSLLAFLLVIAIVLTAPEGVSIDWGLYLIIGFTVIQAIVAVAVLLVRCGRHRPARAEAATVRPAVRPVRRPRRAVLRTAPARWPAATAVAATAAGPPAAPGISVALRRATRVAGRRRRRIRRRSAERTPDPADRIPHLRPAAGRHADPRGADADPRGADADANVGVFHAVRA